MRYKCLIHIVLGLPVDVDSIKCPSCSKLANREDFNQYVQSTGACPWCENTQTPIYGRQI